MKARVRNFLGVKSADLELNGIALVGGLNNQGKSSLCEAVLAVALGNPDSRGMAKKKEHELLVHVAAEGEDQASIASSMLLGDGWQVRLTWPDGALEAAGQPQTFGTPLAVGGIRFSQLSEKQRAAELTSRLQMEPKLADLEKFLAERSPHFVAKRQDGSLAEVIWQRIEDSGWDAVLASAQEGGTKLKGSWEQITKQRWGSAKAANWTPATLLADGEYDLDEMKAAYEAAQKAYDKLAAQGAPPDPDQLTRARNIAATLPEAEKKLAAIDKERPTVDAKLEAARTKFANSPEPVGDKPYQPCPCCRQPLKLVQAPSGGFFIEAAPKAVSGEDTKAMRLARQAAEQEVAKLSRRLDELTAERIDTLNQIAKAKQHAELVKTLTAARPANEDELIAARATLDAAKQQYEDVERMKAAKNLYLRWENNNHIIDALKADGVRAAKAREGLQQMNAKIAELAAVSGYSAPSVTDGFGIEVNGRPFALLSESEKWRADLLLTLTFARLEKCRLIVVDRFDVLVPALRKGALLAINSVGIPTLLSGTIDAPEKMPNLAKAGIGQTWWMEGGKLSLAAP